MVKKEVGCCDWIEFKEDIYFSAFEHRILCKANKKTGEVKIITEYKGDKTDLFLSYSTVCECNGKLFFSPLNLDELYVYDLNTESLKIIPVVIEKKDNNYLGEWGRDKFWATYVYEGSVYLFGWHYASIMKINADTLEIEYISNLIDKIPLEFMKNINVDNTFFGNGCVVLGKYLYVASGIGSGIWKMSLDVKNIEYIEIGSGFKGFFSIAEINGKLLLTTKNMYDDRIIMWNPNDSTSKEIHVCEKSGWRTPVIYKGSVYLFPGWGNSHILKVNPSNGKCERFNRLDKLLQNDSNDSVIAIKQIGRIVTFIRTSDCCWFTYDFENDELTGKYYRLSEDYYHKYIKAAYDDFYNNEIKKNNIILEKDLPLAEFLSRI